MKASLVALAFLLFANAAMAAIPPSALNSVGISLERDAAFPLSLSARDADGMNRSLGQLLTAGPTFVLFADYTCKALCGPALVFLPSALASQDAAENSPIIGIGLDPK